MMTTVALAGNPNVGKSSIFNALTGSRQHVGNWPGKTVEKKEGRLRLGDREILIVDLPGAYSLTAYSVEEIIARDYILHEHPTAVVAVIDASNLERNLYLVAQILEMQTPVIIALNMADVAASRGLHIDSQQLSQRLGGIPVVETVGNRSLGLDQLKEAIRQVIGHAAQPPTQPSYPGILGQELDALKSQIQANRALSAQFQPHWLAIKLLEADSAILDTLETQGAAALLAAAEAARERIEAATGEDAETLIADRRYTFIGEVINGVLERPSQSVFTISDRVDQIVTHRIWGLPIFLLIMWLVFQFTANVSAPLLDWVDLFINETVYGWAVGLLAAVGLAGTWPAALITDGIIAGVGGVLVFVPGLLVLYFFLALLEDSGYMARAAFVMDRFMRIVGLHGKSFIPMVLGFGCAVPAIYATRTLAGRRDRILTALLVPLMSCSARLPVYVVFGMAFFGSQASTVIWLLYALGIFVALAAGLIFTRTLLKPDTASAFVLELPPYRRPTAKGTLVHMWDNTAEFVRKAGTLIFALSIVMWLLLRLPLGVTDQQESYFGRISTAIAPVLAPLGFGEWQTAGALVTGLAAKEIVVSTMSQLYVGEETAAAAEIGAERATITPASFVSDLAAIGRGFVAAAVDAGRILLSLIPGVNLMPQDAAAGQDTALSAALQRHFTPLTAFAFLVFVLLYVPCIATIGAIKHEFGASWAAFSAVYQTAVAWGAAFLVFQGGRLLGLQ